MYFQSNGRNQTRNYIPSEHGRVRNGRCRSLLHQDAHHPEAGGRRKCHLWMPSWRKPQTTHHLEEERRTAHYWIQVHNIKAAINKYFHYRLIGQLFSWLFAPSLSVVFSIKWAQTMSCLVWSTVQNLKIFTLLSFMTQKGFKMSHLKRYNQQMFGIFT